MHGHSGDGQHHREPLSPGLAVITVMKAMVGVAVLTLPHVFGQVRLALAIPGLILVAAVVIIGTYRLIQCKVLLAEKDKIDDSLHTPDMEDYGLGPLGLLSKRALGLPGLIFAVICATLTQFGTCVAYQDVIVETVMKQDWGVSDVAVRLVLCIVLCVLSLVRSLGEIACLSCMALSVYGYVVFALCRFGIEKMLAGENPPLRDAWLPVRLGNFGNFFGSSIFAFEGFVVCQYVYDKMGHASPLPFLRVLMTSCALAFALYSFVGGFGYFIYGDLVADIIYESFPQDTLDVKVCEIVLILVLLVTFILQIYPVYSVMEATVLDLDPNDGVYPCGVSDASDTEEDLSEDSDFFHQATGRARWRLCMSSLALRWLIVFLSGLAAYAVPDVTKVVGLVGGICFGPLSFTIPSLIHISLKRQEMTLFDWLVDTVMILTGLLAAALALLQSI